TGVFAGRSPPQGTGRYFASLDLLKRDGREDRQRGTSGGGEQLESAVSDAPDGGESQAFNESAFNRHDGRFARHAGGGERAERDRLAVDFRGAAEAVDPGESEQAVVGGEEQERTATVRRQHQRLALQPDQRPRRV